MPDYNELATSLTPASIVFVLDSSHSMTLPFSRGEKRFEAVNRCLRDVLVSMTQMCMVGEHQVVPKYRIAIIAYNSDVENFTGGFMGIDEFKAAPEVVPRASTNTAAAFREVLALLEPHMPHTKGCPPPMVIHLTDGEFKGDDPEPVARQIRALRNDDGHVLLENVFIGEDLLHEPLPSEISTWTGIRSVDQIRNPYAQQLYGMSSPLPFTYAEVLKEIGHPPIAANTPLLIPATHPDLVRAAFTMATVTGVGGA